MSVSSLRLYDDMWRYCGSFLDAATRRDSGVFPVRKIEDNHKKKFETLFINTVPQTNETNIAWVSYVKRSHRYYSETEESWVEWTVMKRVLRNKSSVERELHREPHAGLMVLVDNEDFLYFWMEGSYIHTYTKIKIKDNEKKVFKQFLYSF